MIMELRDMVYKFIIVFMLSYIKIHKV